MQNNKEGCNEIYKKKRQTVLTYLKRLCDKYEYSDHTYYQAVDYLDKILIAENELKFDLTAIGCMVLSCK